MVQVSWTLLRMSEKAKPKTHHVLTTALGYMDASRQAWQDLLLGTITQVKATKSHLQCRCVGLAHCILCSGVKSMNSGIMVR